MEIGPIEVVIDARGDDVFPQFLNEIGLLNNDVSVKQYPTTHDVKGKHVCCLSCDIGLYLSLMPFAAHVTVIYYNSKNYTLDDLRIYAARPAIYRIEYLGSV